MTRTRSRVPPPRPKRGSRRLATLLAGPDAADRSPTSPTRVPASYRERTPPEEAALDMASWPIWPCPGPPKATRRGRVLRFGGHHRLVVRPALDGDEGTFRIRRYGERGIELTRFLPVLESFGLVVVESVPLPDRPRARTGNRRSTSTTSACGSTRPTAPRPCGSSPRSTAPAWSTPSRPWPRGETEVDSLNRLVTVAGLDWRQVTVLRAYLRYWLQGGTVALGRRTGRPAGDLSRGGAGADRVLRGPVRPGSGTGPASVARPPRGGTASRGMTAETIERARCTRRAGPGPAARSRTRCCAATCG